MPDPIPKGLVLFARPLTPRQRRRRWMFAFVVVLSALALVWPGYVLVDGVYPLILGLPFNLAWIVGWLAVVMAGLFALYRADYRPAQDHPINTES